MQFLNSKCFRSFVHERETEKEREIEIFDLAVSSTCDTNYRWHIK